MPDAVHERDNRKMIYFLLGERGIDVKLQTAQRHGLFSTNDAQSLDEELFAQIPDLDARWKAWSRIECVKR